MPLLMTLASSSRGNCTFVSDGRTHILVDAGISARRIAAALRAADIGPQELSGVLITHEHADHVSGLATLTKRYGLPVYAGLRTAAALERTIAPQYIRPFEIGNDFMLGGLGISSFLTPHDTPESAGYVIRAGNSSAVIATDMGHVTETARQSICRADILLIEANHDIEMLKNGSYPYYLKRRILGARGHLSNLDCAAAVLAAVKSGVTRVLLGHLSEENNTPELALETVGGALRVDGAEQDRDYALCVAPRTAPGEIFQF